MSCQVLYTGTENSHRCVLLMRRGKLKTYGPSVESANGTEQIESGNGTEMQFVDWVEVTIRLVGSTAEFHVPMLVMKGN